MEPDQDRSHGAEKKRESRREGGDFFAYIDRVGLYLVHKGNAPSSITTSHRKKKAGDAAFTFVHTPHAYCVVLKTRTAQALQ